MRFNHLFNYYGLDSECFILYRWLSDEVEVIYVFRGFQNKLLLDAIKYDLS